MADGWEYTPLDGYFRTLSNVISNGYYRKPVNIWLIYVYMVDIWEYMEVSKNRGTPSHHPFEWYFH